jgi:RNA polymerase sigma-70 factor, ECF subfamily
VVLRGRCPTTTSKRLAKSTFSDILDQARQLDKAAITTLYERALPPIYRYVLLRVSQRDLVEDIVAEIFLEMVESLPTLQTNHEAGFYAWLFGIARTKLIKTRQRSARINAWQDALPEPTTDAAADLPTSDRASDPVAWQEWRELLDELGLALESLTAEQQFVVVGRFLAGQSIEEIAYSLAKQPGTVRALQFRALRTLAKKLTPRNALRHEQPKGGKA